MKSSSILIFMGFALLSTALDVVGTRSLASGGVLNRRGHPGSMHRAFKMHQKDAEKEASKARDSHNQAKKMLVAENQSNLAKRPQHGPERRVEQADMLAADAMRVAHKQRSRGDAYSKAATASEQVDDVKRTERNNKKSSAAYAGAKATEKEVQYAREFAKHEAFPNHYANNPVAQQSLRQLKTSYVWANADASAQRQQGGRDTDSDSDGESPGKPIRPLLSSIHGMKN